MMHTRKIPSILILAILVAVMTISSSTLLTPVLAQSSTEQGGESSQDESDTGTDTGADTSTAKQDYQEFNTCLTEAEGEEGFATEDEIRECFQPIYIGSEASQDDDESDEGSGDEDDNNTESDDSEN
jgi:hypothetical protein